MKKERIEKMIYEKLGFRVLKKGELRLNEDDVNGDDAIYVDPSKSSSTSMSTAIDKAVQNNKRSGENDFVVDPNDFSNGGASDGKEIGIDITAKNGTDAQKKIQQTMQSPQMRTLADKGELHANVHMESKKANKKLVEGIRFSKSEMDEFLKSI